MRFLLGGASGLIGTALATHLTANGHQVTKLVRDASSNGIPWNPDNNEIGDISGFDAIVHLGGSRIDVRWSDEQKKRIRESRIGSTALIANAIDKLDVKPSVFVCASAMGIYGNRGEELLTEESSLGSDFLAEICKEWESASQCSIRTVNLRTGHVLSGAGGLLGRLLPFFRLGVGGPLGNGKQYMSWIAISDHVRAVEFLVKSDVSGAVNLTAANPVTNEAFSRALAKALHRPCFFRVPGFALSLVYGQMANEALLAGQRLAPKKLMDAGFKFEHETLEDALKHVI